MQEAASLSKGIAKGSKTNEDKLSSCTPAQPQAPLVDEFHVHREVDVDPAVEKDLEDVVNKIWMSQGETRNNL